MEVEGVSCGVPKVQLNLAVVLSPSRPTTGLVAPSPINTRRMLNATYRDTLLFSWGLLPVLACSIVANEIVIPYRAGAGHTRVAQQVHRVQNRPWELLHMILCTTIEL